ncbi:MAG: MBL fold metallo-hydrolase [Proteobacteria bacterium]|nr:MBL fold metallo-hydrolase [Pseudomonadota bacterium]
MKNSSIKCLALATMLAMVSICGCLEIDRPIFGQDEQNPAGSTEYKISIVTFGHSNDQPKKDYVAGTKDEKVSIVWMFWLIEGGGRKIIIDPGFYSDEIRDAFKVQGYIKPDAALAEIDILPTEITDVVLSHYHEPRIDALRLYPNARYHLQSANYAYARKWISRNKHEEEKISIEVIEHMEKMDTKGRLSRMDTTFELFDGFGVHTHNLHTKWFSYFVINSESGHWVIASDLVPFYENVKLNLRIPGASRKLMRLTYQTMKEFANGIYRILPGVDSRVIDRFAAVSDHVHVVAGGIEHSMIH